MRPETAFILSSLDVRTLAEFPPALDPCVNEALRNERVINAIAAGTGVLGVTGTLEPLTRADFGGTELVEDHLPEYLVAWYTAFCSNFATSYIKHLPKLIGRYRVATCATGPGGSHGGCPHCAMCKVRWELITPVEPVPVPVAPITPVEPVPMPMPVAWDCKTAGVGYSCTSPGIGTVILRHRPGRGSVRAAIAISVPPTGGRIEFGYSASVASWSNPICMKINGNEVLRFSGSAQAANVGISGVSGSGSKTIDVSKYAGKVVTLEIVSADDSRWSTMSDHNFDITVRDFKCIGCRVVTVDTPTPTPIIIPVPVAPITPVPVPVAPGVPVRADYLRQADVNVREAFAKIIIRVAVDEADAISTPTPLPGVVMPKPETGLPPIPITIPTMVLKIPDVEVRGANTIEFQELIPGLKPPAIPLLIPGLEKLPLLPGWTVRNPEGRVVSEGARIPTLPPGIIGIKIPAELPEPPAPVEALAILGAEHLAPEEAYYPDDAILEETGSEFEPTVPTEMSVDETLDLGDEDGVEETVLTEELEEESLEM